MATTSRPSRKNPTLSPSPKVDQSNAESAKKIQKAWKDLQEKRERQMREVRMEPTKMQESRDESFEIEPTCIKNDFVAALDPYFDQPLLREQSGTLGLTE